MRSLVVFVAALALSAAAPSDQSAKKRSVGHVVAYNVPSVVAEPVLEARALYSSPAVYAPSATVYSSGSAVSHQSRVDVHSSPAVIASAPAVVAAPTFVEASPVVEARSLYAAPLYSAPAAVSHQSRYDVRTSPAVISQHVVSPAVYGHHLVSAPAVVDARSVWSPSVYAASW